MTKKPTAGMILEEVGAPRSGRESLTISQIFPIGSLKSLELLAKLQKKLFGREVLLPMISMMISRLPVVKLGGTLSNTSLQWLLIGEGLASRAFVGGSLVT